MYIYIFFFFFLNIYIYINCFEKKKKKYIYIYICSRWRLDDPHPFPGPTHSTGGKGDWWAMTMNMAGGVWVGPGTWNIYIYIYNFKNSNQPTNQPTLLKKKQGKNLAFLISSWVHKRLKSGLPAFSSASIFASHENGSAEESSVWNTLPLHPKKRNERLESLWWSLLWKKIEGSISPRTGKLSGPKKWQQKMKIPPFLGEANHRKDFQTKMLVENLGFHWGLRWMSPLNIAKKRWITIILSPIRKWVTPLKMNMERTKIKPRNHPIEMENHLLKLRTENHRVSHWVWFLSCSSSIARSKPSPQKGAHE